MWKRLTPVLSFLSFCAATGTVALEPPYAVPNFAAPGSSSWPSPAAWQALNTSVEGRLEALTPWAAVCYTSDPLFDPTKCQTVLSNYNDDITRESIPSALLWPNWESCGYNNSCALNHTNPQIVNGSACNQGTTPPYSVPISSAQDASAIIKWAVANQVKLTIKNTGHDYLGRSAGPATLQVNTHSLDTMTYIPDFVPQGSSATPVPALTIGAGAQLYNIYAYAEANNFSAVLGACSTVGAAGGYLQGGGHGVLTPAYGLGADHVLEVEIVTADGKIRTVNAAQDSDLFWAVRGGGAGSWGIVISTTIEALPVMSISASLLVVVPNPAQDAKTLGINFISLVGKYQNQLINSGIVTSFVFFESQYVIYFYWPTPSTSLSSLYPFFTDLIALAGNYTVASNTTAEAMFPSVSAAQQENIGPFFDSTSFYGASTELASRLVPQSMLSPSNPESISRVAEAIWEGLQIVGAPLKDVPAGTFTPDIAVFILGDMPAATREKANQTGANPGLYEASWHIAYAAPWTIGVSKETYSAVTEAIYNATSPLSALGLTSSYQNEGSAWETNWQEAFFGSKYTTLSQIKQKYDPNNFFTTYKGVASVVDSEAYQCYRLDED
ncbi:hypothetical protein HYDPIDRAFT_26869 [Hydnomerulius pinastri MD-312]|nr:hypothetical protein HYDPIDRAFT_26869 [Hydnomerulius pinastri MD-312]